MKFIVATKLELSVPLLRSFATTTILSESVLSIFDPILRKFNEVGKLSAN